MKHLIFVMLVIGMFIMGCNSFIIAGLLPQISQTIQQPIAITGQGITAFSLSYFIAGPLFSVIFSNKSVKLIIQIALIVFVLGSLITLISKTIILFLIGRFLTGIGTGIFIPLCLTLAVHIADESSKGRRLSWIWGANSAGAVFGVPLGLYISSLLNWQLSIVCIISLSILVFFVFSFQNLNIKLPVSPLSKYRFYRFIDQKIMLVLGITFFISTASLGLYSYLAVVQSGVANSLVMTVFIWGLGGFIGSSLVGILIDLTKKPQMIVGGILIGLMLTFVIIPFTMGVPYLGLIPFFVWGVLGWAMPTTQQHILFELQEQQGTIIAALNGSAMGLGSVVGTALGGLLIASGLPGIDLPFLAAMLLFIAFFCQFMFIKSSEGVTISE
jgi:predicted MFS family arabinose efflux permease